MIFHDNIIQNNIRIFSVIIMTISEKSLKILVPKYTFIFIITLNPPVNKLNDRIYI